MKSDQRKIYFGLMNSEPIMVRKGLRLTVAVACTAAATLCGMFAQVLFGVTHRNAVWEPLFGIGYGVAGWLFHPYAGNRIIGAVGLIWWPFLVVCGISFASWRLAARFDRRAKYAAMLFIASLCLWVGDSTANSLSIRGVPFFFNYYASNY